MHWLTQDLSKFRGILRLLCFESLFAVAFETWISPAYLSGLAGELKISLGLISVLAAIPFIGASGQILGAWAFERTPSVKKYVLGIACIGRSLWSIPLLFASYWGWKSHSTQAPFPIATWFTLAGSCACLSAFLTSASTNAWMYWMKTIVPTRFQGRFFGCRQRFTTSGFVVASLIGAYFLGWNPQGYRIGLGLLCCFALISAGISIFLHSKVNDVPAPSSSSAPPWTLMEIIREPLNDPKFRPLLIFGASFNGAIQLASSYFPYYFTKDLHIPLSSIALWSGLTNVGCFMAATYWGRRIDRSRTPFDVLWFTGHIVALSPLIYVIKSSTFVQIIAPFEYLLNGLAWCGFLLGQTKYLFRSSPIGKSAAYFSVYASACGLSGAVCTFLGGQIVQQFQNGIGFQVLWIVAATSRLGVLWFLGRPLLGHQKGTSMPAFFPVRSL